MFSSKRRTGIAAACAALVSMAVPAGSMAAVKVDLRVEGASRTLFDKKVRTAPAMLRANSGPVKGRYPCDVVGNGGSGPRAATPASALVSSGLAVGRRWYPDLAGFMITSVSREASGDLYWDYFVNGKGAAAIDFLGPCQFGLRSGDSVVWALTDGSQSLLRLKASGGGSAAAVKLMATSGATGAPVAGARVGTLVTGADGAVEVPRPARGSVRVNATANGFIRSNTVRIGALR